MNVEIVAISRDLSPSQQKFKETVQAKNTFLSDVDAVVIKKYDAFDAPRGIAKRFYFLIDENGKVIWESTSGALIPVDKLLEDLTAAVKGGR